MTYAGRIQPVVATPLQFREYSTTFSASVGVFQASVLRGRVFSAVATAAISVGPYRDMSVPFGKYWRSRPFVFAFVPRCHGEGGSQKQTPSPVSRVTRACSAISVPRSHVRVRRS